MKKYILLYETYSNLIVGVKYRITYEDSNNYYYKTSNETITFCKSDENKKFETGDINL